MEAILRNLRSQIESQSNTLDAAALDSLLTDLERYPITLPELQTTRVGKLLNDLRRRPGVSVESNTRMRSIIKLWRSMVDNAAAASSISPAPSSSISSSVNKTETTIPSSVRTPLSSIIPEKTKIPSENGRKLLASSPTPSSQSHPPPPTPSTTDNTSLSQRKPWFPSSTTTPSETSNVLAVKNGNLSTDYSPICSAVPPYVSADVLSLKSDKSNRSGSQRTVTSTSTAKVKSTADLMAEYKSIIHPELAGRILSQDSSVKEPALPKSVLPQSARPRRLKDKEIIPKKGIKDSLIKKSNHHPPPHHNYHHHPPPGGTTKPVVNGAHKRSPDLHNNLQSSTKIANQNKSKRGKVAIVTPQNIIADSFNMTTTTTARNDSFPLDNEITKSTIMQKFLESITEPESPSSHSSSLPIPSSIHSQSQAQQPTTVSSASPHLEDKSTILSHHRHHHHHHHHHHVHEPPLSSSSHTATTIHRSKKKKSKQHHTTHSNASSISFPITNHMNYWPELPPLTTTSPLEETPIKMHIYSDNPPTSNNIKPTSSLLPTSHSLQSQPPPSSELLDISSKLFLSPFTLPNRNCTQILGKDGKTIKNVEFTECFTAPLNDDSNIHVLPWCCLQDVQKGNLFLQSPEDRLTKLMQRSAAW